MSKNNPQAELKMKNEKVKNVKFYLIFAFLIFTFTFTTACRYDMQDQPKYRPFKENDFFKDKRASRDLPEGTVARGKLRDDKAFYTGKIENPNPNAQTQTVADSSGNSVVASFPNDLVKSPVPLTEELVNRGQERYNVYCIVCHGPVGSGDGMIVRRGFSKPPTYHDDRLRNAPDGHFFDVMTNGWGKMNSYAAQIPPADRWAIVAYIRALQVSQNPNEDNDKKTNRQSNSAVNNSMTNSSSTANTNSSSNENSSQGGTR